MTGSPSNSPNNTVSLGYTIFFVDDVDATLRFYQDGFGLERRMLTPEGDYGELDTGATVLAFVSNQLAEANLGAVGGFAPLDPNQPPVAASITLVTDDVSAVAKQAVAAGAELLTEPADKPWGQTVANTRDPNGILIEIATPVGG